MSSRDIFQRLYDEGFNVSIRTIERDLSRLPDIFPSLIEVDDRSKPFTYRQPINARKYSAMNPTEAICLELAFIFKPIFQKHSTLSIHTSKKQMLSSMNNMLKNIKTGKIKCLPSMKAFNFSQQM